MENLLAIAALAGGAAYYLTRKPAPAAPAPAAAPVATETPVVAPTVVTSILGTRVMVLDMSVELQAWLIQADQRILAVPIAEFVGNTPALVTTDLEATAVRLGGVDALIAHLLTVGYDIMAAAPVSTPAATVAAAPTWAFTGAKKLAVQPALYKDPTYDRVFSYSNYYTPWKRMVAPFGSAVPPRNQEPVTIERIRRSLREIKDWAFRAQTKYPLNSGFVYFRDGQYFYPTKFTGLRFASDTTSQMQVIDWTNSGYDEQRRMVFTGRAKGVTVQDAHALVADAEHFAVAAEKALRAVAAGDTAKMENGVVFATILYALRQELQDRFKHGLG
jgi:hypothetical protein